MATATAALALVACAMGACRKRPEPLSRSGTAAVLPPELAVTTSRFELVSSAYVELLAARARSAAAGDTRSTSVLGALSACPDEACERDALAGDPEALRVLPEYLQADWPRHAERVRVTVDAATRLLAATEDVVAPEIVRGLGLDWPTSPVRVLITATGGEGRPVDPWSDPAFDAAGECFSGAAFLECAFEHAARAAMGDGSVLAAIEHERSSLAAAGKEATKNLSRAVAMFVVGGAVRHLTPSYVPGRHFVDVREEDERVRAWLSREWDKRASGEESAAAFGARAVRELSGAPTHGSKAEP